jgi:citrate lyase subunit beta/citryl-CoA lyase
MLFCPGGRPEVVAKLARFRADVSVVDLEDAVAPADKQAARRTAVAAIGSLRGAAPDLAVFLRVNGTATGWFADDVAVAVDSAATGIVLPKLSAPAQAVRLRDLLDRAGRSDVPIIGGIETGVGVLRCEDLAAGPVDAVYFGAEDLMADVGGRRTRSGGEVLYARSRVLLAAAVAGLPALDQVVTDFADLERFRSDAEVGRDLGYTGKMCIHPGQVELAHQVFTPSVAAVAHAEAVLAAYERAAEAGAGGVAVVDGAMIDGPHVAAARRVIDSAANVG